MSFDPTEDSEALFTNEETAAETTENEAADEADEDTDGDEAPEKASPAARKLEPIILAHVLAPKYQPVKPRVIAKQLKLPSEQHKALKLAIRRLVKSGKLSFGSGHQVRPPQPAKQLKPRPSRDRDPLTPTRSQRERGQSKHIVTGTFRRTAAGFGFVRPQGATRGDKSSDVYIPARSTMDAADRDVVRVRLSKHQARGRKGELRQAGEIVEIVERDTHQFVGEYKERQGTSYVEVDGKVFAEPIPVGLVKRLVKTRLSELRAR